MLAIPRSSFEIAASRIATDDGNTPLAPGGSLRDIAPTLLGVLGLPVPEEMSGRDLRERK